MLTELILTRATYHQALRSLLISPHQFAVGTMRVVVENNDCELLVERFRMHRTISGDRLAPLASWCVMCCQESRDLSPRAWAERLAPHRAQQLAVVVLTIPRTEPVTCESILLNRGEIIHIDGIRIIGSHMMHLLPSAPMPDDFAEPNEQPSMTDDVTATNRGISLSPHRTSIDGDRWSRTVGALGTAVHRKVRGSCVAMVGAGRNGAHAAWHLAALGIRELRIIEHDRLESCNLDAMLGIDPADVGRPKAEALAEKLVRFRPDLAITCVNRSVTDPESIALLRRRSDLIVTCVDNNMARMAASLIARERLIMHLDIGSSVQRRTSATAIPPTAVADTISIHAATSDRVQITADVRLLMPGAGCVACVGSMPDLEDVLYNLSAPPGALLRGVPRIWSDERAGSLLTINSIAIGTGIQAWLDVLSGQVDTSMWYRLAWNAGMGIQADSGAVGAGDNCPFCGRELSE